MELFSLLSEEKVLTEAGKKVIKSSDFTKLKKAATILNQTKQEAKEYKLDVAKECEQYKSAAYQEGFLEGLKQFHEALAVLEKDIKTFKEDINKKILPISLKAAKKIVGEELKTHPDRIFDIVMQALKPVMQHRHVTIYVNHSDLEHLEKEKASLQKFLAQAETFSIQEKPDLEPGDCIIQTEAGIINAQLDNQWRALEAAFKKFMK